MSDVKQVRRTSAPPGPWGFSIGKTSGRGVRYSVLLDFPAHPGHALRERDLAELIGNATPDEFREIRLALEHPERAIPVLLAKLDIQGPFNEAGARRRGRIAASLIVLGSPDRAWPVLASGSQSDSGARTELINDLAAYGAS